MTENRKQLTLFIHEPNGFIEEIRSEYNPEQYNLISAHVTLCREDEIEPIEKIFERIQSIKLNAPLRITFEEVERFADGKGVLIPASLNNNQFRELRQSVLGQFTVIKEQLPHITLMHPRNSTCTDEIFEQIRSYELPNKLDFGKISLIEQKNGGKWNVIQEFNIVNKKGSSD